MGVVTSNLDMFRDFHNSSNSIQPSTTFVYEHSLYSYTFRLITLRAEALGNVPYA
jgi:hypothetical protein